MTVGIYDCMSVNVCDNLFGCVSLCDCVSDSDNLPCWLSDSVHLSDCHSNWLWLSERLTSVLSVPLYCRPEDVVRLERLPDESFDHSSATRCISEFYETEASEVNSELCKLQIPSSGSVACVSNSDPCEKTCSSNPALQMAINLPKTVQICFAALVRYLKDFKLEKVLRMTRWNFILCYMYMYLLHAIDHC